MQDASALIAFVNSFSISAQGCLVEFRQPVKDPEVALQVSTCDLNLIFAAW